MSDFDFEKFKNIKLDIPQMDFRPAQEALARINRQNEETFRAIEEAREEKEAEELRRHNELISALKEAGEKGATIVIGDNAKSIQIQQNSSGAKQTLNTLQELDYDEVRSVLNEIRGYYGFPQFSTAFGDNTENVKSVVENTLIAVENGEDESLVKKSLRVLRDLAIGAAGSLVASGIIALLGTLPIG